MDGPEPTTASFEYISTEDLTALEDPAKHRETLVDDLSSKDWQLVFKTLTTLRQLAKFQPDSLSSDMEPVLGAVLKSVKSPRSTLSKAGLMAAADMLNFCANEAQGQENLKDLLLQLLLKASQDKKFLGDEAVKALAAMVKQFPSEVALGLLEPFCTHNNGRIRAKATASYSLAASIMSPQQVLDYGFEKLLKVAGKQISDQLPEAREAARKLAQQLHRAYAAVSHNGVATLLTESTARKGEPQEGAGANMAEARGAVEHGMCEKRDEQEPVDASAAASEADHDAKRAKVRAEPSEASGGEATGEGAASKPEEGQGTKEGDGSPWELLCKSTLPVLEANAILSCTASAPDDP